MKRPRAPYARRSVWVAIAILSGVFVIGAAIAGYEINHLHNEVNTLQSQLAFLLQTVLNAGKK
ncbi:MAG TPA: hypothetical protein VNG12_06965 [Acidimicrobiales bacterium]|nr:hypothetical protein [Acidimicrobiales bacterium]